MAVQFTLIGGDEGESNIVVFVTGGAPLVAHSSHPNFNRIVQGAMDGDESVVKLFDIASSITENFRRLTERVTTRYGKLYLDGEEVHNSLTTQVLRFMDQGSDDWKPLVLFFENVQANPNEHSREQLYTWLDKEDFTITPDGMIVGYKGVAKQVDGSLVSINRGKAIVDGRECSGAIPNYLGAVVEMPRGEVQHDPSVGCHTGLHVGTFDYASGFARGALLEVHVNPRDVVSVPSDCNAAKMRTCRYTVVGTIDAKYDTAVVPYDYEDDDEPWWGDNEGDDWYDTF